MLSAALRNRHKTKGIVSIYWHDAFINIYSDTNYEYLLYTFTRDSSRSNTQTWIVYRIYCLFIQRLPALHTTTNVCAFRLAIERGVDKGTHMLDSLSLVDSLSVGWPVFILPKIKTLDTLNRKWSKQIHACVCVCIKGSSRNAESREKSRNYCYFSEVVRARAHPNCVFGVNKLERRRKQNKRQRNSFALHILTIGVGVCVCVRVCVSVV